MSELMLETRRLTVGYQGRGVVHDFDLTVSSGEIVALFGANGAGKTTALLTLAGALAPVSGEVRLFGQPHPGRLLPAARRGLALLTDDRAIFPSLSARDNLKLGRGSIDDVLAYFPELEDHLDVRAGLLSGGQQQMLSLGRILASRPRVILADELSLGLAPLIVVRLLAALRTAAEAGAGVLLVEQHVTTALKFVDRACVFAHGHLAVESAANEVTPATITDLYL